MQSEDVHIFSLHRGLHHEKKACLEIGRQRTPSVLIRTNKLNYENILSDIKMSTQPPVLHDFGPEKPRTTFNQTAFIYEILYYDSDLTGEVLFRKVHNKCTY